MLQFLIKYACDEEEQNRTEGKAIKRRAPKLFLFKILVKKFCPDIASVYRIVCSGSDEGTRVSQRRFEEKTSCILNAAAFI